jgi:signal-transduction protein with cAMP-binding, CBS, and nucleotidyltransferase domain
VPKYELTARDIMQTEIATILGDASVSDAAHQMRAEGVRSLIVVPRDEHDSLAIITYSDIVSKVLATGRDPERVAVDEVMTKPLITISPTMVAQHIAGLFKQTGIGHAPVIECNKLIGIVSMTDLITEVINEMK